jgi:hypothetical protein
MKKSILKMGAVLSKSEQQQINGGFGGLGGGGFIGSGCSPNCPGFLANGQHVPCGSNVPGFFSACVPCELALEIGGFECRVVPFG